MPKILTFTTDEEGNVKMSGTMAALLMVWEKREELKSIKMEHIPLCG
jgi:hypothetical protein